jgi:hypothetical protein
MKAKSRILPEPLLRITSEGDVYYNHQWAGFTRQYAATVGVYLHPRLVKLPTRYHASDEPGFSLVVFSKSVPTDHIIKKIQEKICESDI